MNLSVSAARVLILDDEPFQLRLLVQQFRLLGVTDVESFLLPTDVLARLKQAEPEWPDLLCCDLQMPGMDGIEFVRHLGQIGYSGTLMLISGEDHDVLHAAGRLAASWGLRVGGAFQKPVHPDQLRQALQSAASRPSEPASRAAPAVKRHYSGEELARAIDNGELCNHYQPKVDLATGRFVGVEALVRWQHPDHGLVFPDQFIHLAEGFGLIDRLTQAVVFGPQGALRQARLWKQVGLSPQIAVNVSMENLTHHGFADLVFREAAASDIEPAQLIIEVTESRMMHNVQAALDILTRMRLKRVGVSIDDFGTGHASLAQLREIPFNELKIDRGFVHGACRDASLRAILLPSLDMARRLGIRSVAEGVEDAEDWHYLRAQDCDLAQGYFIARPMAPDALPAWTIEWESRRAALVSTP